MLTLHAVAMYPDRLTWRVELADAKPGVLRPLLSRDQAGLEAFLTGLGPETRILYDVVEPSEHALEMCEAIDRYDKLRFVLEDLRGLIQGVVELSFGLPESDRLRFADYGLELEPGQDVRFGLCLADAFQGLRVAPKLYAHVVDAVRQFGCSRVLLWGGVFEHNERARRFYEGVGFVEVGRFTRSDGRPSLDMIATL